MLLSYDQLSTLSHYFRSDSDSSVALAGIYIIDQVEPSFFSDDLTDAKLDATLNNCQTLLQGVSIPYLDASSNQASHTIQQCESVALRLPVVNGVDMVMRPIFRMELPLGPDCTLVNSEPTHYLCLNLFVFGFDVNNPGLAV